MTVFQEAPGKKALQYLERTRNEALLADSRRRRRGAPRQRLRRIESRKRHEGGRARRRLTCCTSLVATPRPHA